MKRMKLGAAAAVLCLILGMTAQAAGSSASGVQISQDPITATVVKADGTTVESAQVIPVIEEGNTEAPAATVESALGIGSGEKYASYKLEVSLELNGEDVKLSGGSVTMTFQIPGVTANSKVAVLHWADGSSEPEKLSATAGEGTVTATFTSFSPVQIVVAQESGSNGGNGSGSGNSGSGSSSSGSSAAPAAVSPKTAEGNELYMAAAVAVIALTGFAVCMKKARY